MAVALTRTALEGCMTHVIPTQRIIEEYRAHTERFGSSYVLSAAAGVLNEREMREFKEMIDADSR